jgi:hypothetical protein
MPTNDVYLTVLEVVNEVRRKIGVPNAVTSLTTDSLDPVMVDFLNDVITEINDFGLWNEMIGVATTTLISGQEFYSISTSDPVKTIKDIYFQGTNSSLAFITNEQMRLLKRTNANSNQPTMFTIFGVDVLGNPNIQLYPTPNNTAAGKVINVFYQKLPFHYDTSDTDSVLPFYGRLIVQGLVARMILDQSGGAPNDQYSMERATFENMLKETFNRYKADVGYYRRFVPSNRWWN